MIIDLKYFSVFSRATLKMSYKHEHFAIESEEKFLKIALDTENQNFCALLRKNCKHNKSNFAFLRKIIGLRVQVFSRDKILGNEFQFSGEIDVGF